jgi:hypothetical protein
MSSPADLEPTPRNPLALTRLGSEDLIVDRSWHSSRCRLEWFVGRASDLILPAGRSLSRFEILWG